MRKKIVLRADGNETMGLGHVYRLLALHDMLQANFDFVFAIQQTSASVIENITHRIGNVLGLKTTLPGDYSFYQELTEHLQGDEIIVLDGYHFTTEYQTTLKRMGCKVVCVDDIHAFPFYCDAVINHGSVEAAKHYQVEAFTKLLCGWNYLLLRKQFIDATTKAKNSKQFNRAFICFGGADPQNNTMKVTEACCLSECFESITIVTGAAFVYQRQLGEFIKRFPGLVKWERNVSAERIVSLFDECFISVCPASSIALEACAVNTGLITGTTVDNQMEIHNELVRLKCAFSVGDFNNTTVEELVKFIKTVARPESVENIIRNQSAAIDGHSPERIRRLFFELAA